LLESEDELLSELLSLSVLLLLGRVWVLAVAFLSASLSLDSLSLPVTLSVSLDLRFLQALVHLAFSFLVSFWRRLIPIVLSTTVEEDLARASVVGRIRTVFFAI
jgi:hypothetical protein